MNRFEDLLAWQKSREFTWEIYAATRAESFNRDFSLRDQMRRAAVSMMSNIAEGFGRKSPADFHRFLVIAFGSCQELRSRLYVALDARYISETDFQRLMMQCTEVVQTIGALRASVERRVRE